MNKETPPFDEMESLLESIRERLNKTDHQNLASPLNAGEEGEFLDLLLAMLEQEKIRVNKKEFAYLTTIADFYRSTDSSLLAKAVRRIAATVVGRSCRSPRSASSWRIQFCRAS